MIEQIDHVSAVFVSDLDEAVDFYKMLGFRIKEERRDNPDISWVDVELAGGSKCIALLTFKDAAAFRDRIGGGTGVALVTDDIQRSYQTLREKGVKFEWEPVSRPWGESDALFVDPDNNRLLLVEQESSLTTTGRHHKPHEP